jgi:thiopeptide-type bacteriocin biosynthesis protein
MMKEKVQRDFILGDEWFYVKIYTGVKTADTILLEVIDPLVKELLKENIIDKWFFIRYSDPDFHLRVRFHLTNNSALSSIIIKLNTAIKPFIENNLVNSLQADTYSRELERYGNHAINEAEDVFFYDSNMTLEMLKLIEGDEGEQYRWHFGCMAVDSLLSDFNYSEQEKLNLMERFQHGFGQEFGMNNHLKVQLDKKFREERGLMRTYLLKVNDFYQPFYDILDKKSSVSNKVIKRIISLHQNNNLEQDLNNLLGSYIHMLLNRIFKSKQRLNEMVIYSLLFRFYRSEIARQKNEKQNLSGE